MLQLNTQGSRARRVNPGLEVVNTFGVHVRDIQPLALFKFVNAALKVIYLASA
jgi:hypothetical protein